MDRQALGTSEVIRANSRDLPLADSSVDLVVTSPPYFALRSYQDGGEHYVGQIGDEPTPAEFVDSLLEVTRECVRVLKLSGSLWVNLGDKYAEKTLLGIPWRYALRCIDDLGLILRAEVIWSKPNGLPESVTDRVRRSHEQWFHFTLEPRYYSAVDEIREPFSGAERASGAGWLGRTTGNVLGRDTDAHGGLRDQDRNPLGKLPGSVWTIPTEPLQAPDHLGTDHFAAFPTEWPRRIIQGWSPAGVCVECGEGRRPVTTVDPFTAKAFAAEQQSGGRSWHDGDPGTRSLGIPAAERNRIIIGEACACAEPTAPTAPGVVLDPFGGTGTTAMVAKALGRHGISVDMSADYCRLAEWRTNDPKQLAKAARKPFTASEKPMDGQGDLLSLLGDAS